MTIVGLTGGIGSGKSTVAQYLKELGSTIIDADLIAHELTRKDQKATAEIVKLFGNGCLTEEGHLDRSFLRRQIHEHPADKLKLESLLHPMILNECKQQLKHAKSKTPYHVLMAPLLLEVPDFKNLCQTIIVVSVDREKQITRVMNRNNFNENEVLAIMKNQLSDEERKQQADYLIYNNGTLNELHEEVAKLDQKLKSAPLK
ncbi:dephospho-CoA kinase [Chitinibacter bivalviorum]|uniref:Dephospho-CoA kinase n=1 Tax=Chitinibacter bivalviorum TaxID=2739434 RepID=A0A7H9BJN3_9NEIS|nr:dephospho-CoA kinase [Chitinibacter bivalviorum]QLG88679.1 dephospho-CoA kinase [Chitinibacter bivalviorum]